MENEKQITLQKFDVEKRKMLRLALIMDIVGMLSYFIPLYAESIDFIWSPIAAILHFFMLKGKLGVIGASGTFIEEILPGTDIIPSFSIMWWVKYVWKKESTLKELDTKDKAQ